jgi:hypothetical protein
VVISALNKETNSKVAIKKMAPMAESRTDGAPALRPAVRISHAARASSSSHSFAARRRPSCVYFPPLPAQACTRCARRG